MISVTNLLNYALITFAVYATGSIYCVSLNYSFWISLLFIVSALIYIYSRNSDKALRSGALLKLLFLPLFILIVFLLNNVSRFTSYIAIIMQIVAAYLITKTICYDEFKRKYINIISFLAAVSLVCYIVYLVYPSIALQFPMTEGSASVNYYNAGIHVFQSAKGFGYFVPENRNAGIFWEPGAYQAFLNMGLAFLLATDNIKSKGKKTLFLILAIITTGSTTGYVVLLFLCIIYRKQLFTMIDEKNRLVTMLGILAGAGFLFFSNSNNAYSGIEKLFYEFTSGHYLERLYLDDLKILFQSPLNLLGISFESYEQMGLRTGNSIVYTMVTLGVPFTAILLSMYYDYTKCVEKKGVMFLILVCIFLTESLLWRPFFLCLAWYGSDGNLGKFGKRPAALKQRNSPPG